MFVSFLTRVAMNMHALDRGCQKLRGSQVLLELVLQLPTTLSFLPVPFPSANCLLVNLEVLVMAHFIT